MATYYIAYDGSDSSTTANSPTTPWRTLKQFVENSRTKGDVAILRRVRGGFNPGADVWINNYCSKDAGGSSARNARFNTSGQLTGSWATEANTSSLQKVSGVQGQSKHRHINSTMVDSTSDEAGVVDSGQNGTDTAVNLPGWGYIEHMQPHVLDSNDLTPIDAWTEMWLGRTTNPRDKSRVYNMWLNQYSYFTRTGYGADDNLEPASSGTHDDPIIVMADYENVFGDFLSTKKNQNGDDGFQLWDGSQWDVNEDAQYKVDVGSKILRRMDSNGDPVEVHSYITPGDWICVGELNTAPNPQSFNSNLSDDPYAHSYLVRDINYDKIVLWHPYKGEHAGSQKSIVSMGYAPRACSLMRNGQGTHMYNLYHNSRHGGSVLDFQTTTRHWVFQGIEFFHSHDNTTLPDDHNANAQHMYQAHRNSTMIFVDNGITAMWKDCTFWGQSVKNASWEATNQHYGHNNRGHRHNNFLIDSGNTINMTWEKCLFSGGKYAIYNATQNNSNFKVEDCIFNGSVVDRVCVGFLGEWGKDTTSDNYWYHWFANQVSSEGSIAIRTGNFYGNSWDIVDTEFVNWYGTHVFYGDRDNIQFRGCKFLGLGMDFVDPFTTSNAEAQENLGLRHSRALFAPNNNLNADSVGDNSLKRIDRASGKFVNNTIGTGERLGRQFFYKNTDNNVGTNANSGGVATNDSASWYQRVTTYNAEGTSSNGSRMNGENDNRLYMDSNMLDDSYVSDYDNYPMYNGALALYGAKGLANGTTDNYYTFNATGTATDGLADHTIPSSNSDLIFDWDTSHRSGDGGTWCLTWGGKKRFPHVYGGVPIPPSVPELSKPSFMFSTQWYTYWDGNYGWGYTDNQYWANNHPHGNSSSYWYRQPNNTTLAVWNSGGTNSNYDRADWDTSQGCGRGIGSAPNLGSIYGGTGGYDGDMLPFDSQFVTKVTSQDHYELCLNYDYNFYYNQGAGSLFLGEGEKQLYKPLLTGTNGIARGILYQQGSQYKDRIDGRPANSYWKWWYYRPWLYETITNDDVQQSGGGNYLIRCHPSDSYVSSYTVPNPLNYNGTRNDELTADFSSSYERSYSSKGALKIFEYPFYLSTNARTYSVSLRRAEATGTEDWLEPSSGVGEKFKYATANIPASQVWLEFEYWDMPSNTTSHHKMMRKKSNSLTGVDFSDASWQELSITIEPQSEGVGYLRLFYSKENETNKYNVFYVDPKVVVY